MLLTRKQLCEHLSLKDWTIRQLVKRGKIPFIRINNKVVRFDPEKAQAALTEEFEGKPRTHKPPPGGNIQENLQRKRQAQQKNQTCQQPPQTLKPARQRSSPKT